VYEVHPVRERRESLPGQAKRFGIPIEADQNQLWKALEKRFRVTAETEGRVDEDGARVPECGCKQLDSSLEEDRGVE
jgi:hypothetical protein